MASSSFGKAIYIAATREHTGKTSVSMAILSGLIKRFGTENVGYCKPVGQKWLAATEKGPDGVEVELRVDKDVKVAKDHWKLTSSYNDMSPLVLGSGYTKQYLEGRIDQGQQKAKICHGFERIAREKKWIVIEGTGHCGVGSVVDCNNPQVARMLGVPMLLVSSGSLSSSFDCLHLNREHCLMHGATVAGCITNKVPVEEYSFTREFLGPIVEGEWKIPLVGVVPMAETLDQPSMMDLEALFHAHALSGREHLLRRFSGYQLVTISLRRFLEKLSQNPQRFQNTCFVTHASRSDIIMGLLSHHKFLKSFKGGLITTGSPPGNQLQQYVIEYIKHQSLPVLNVDLSSSKTMKVIEQYTPKMKSNDQDRTGSIVDHYEPHIDFDTLIRIMRQPSCEGWLL